MRSSDIGMLPSHSVNTVIVRTVSGSSYLIDLELMYLTRCPRPNVEATLSSESRPSVALRRDQDAIKILRLYRLEIGAPMAVDLEPLGDKQVVAFTRRFTTEVVAIGPVDSDHSSTGNGS